MLNQWRLVINVLFWWINDDYKAKHQTILKISKSGSPSMNFMNIYTKNSSTVWKWIKLNSLNQRISLKNCHKNAKLQIKIYILISNNFFTSFFLMFKTNYASFITFSVEMSKCVKESSIECKISWVHIFYSVSSCSIYRYVYRRLL